MPEFIPPFFVLTSVGSMLVQAKYLPTRQILPSSKHSSTIKAALGLPLLALGLSLAISTSRRFARVQTEINTFKTPTKIQTDGLFAYTRNPIYLGMLVFLTGVSTMVGDVGSLVMGPCAFFVAANFWYIPIEEKNMTREFGNKSQRCAGVTADGGLSGVDEETAIISPWTTKEEGLVTPDGYVVVPPSTDLPLMGALLQSHPILIGSVFTHSCIDGGYLLSIQYEGFVLEYFGRETNSVKIACIFDHLSTDIYVILKRNPGSEVGMPVGFGENMNYSWEEEATSFDYTDLTVKDFKVCGKIMALSIHV